MRKIKTVKIDLEKGDSKNFTVKELTVRNILELAQNNPFFADTDKPGQQVKKSANGEGMTEETASRSNQPGLLGELSEYGDGIKGIVEMSCDFKMDDLIDLAPSEIEEVFDSFREVNQTFLKILEKVKLLEVFNRMVDRAMINFLEMLPI